VTQPEIVPWEPRLLTAVATLQTRLWSPDPALNERYFRWKHEQNPCFVAPAVYLAMRGARAIAMRGFFGSSWESRGDGAPAPLPIATDAVVAAGHEDTGATRVLMRVALDDLARRGYPCVLNLNASPVTLMSALAAGWTASSPLDSHARPAPLPHICRLRDALRRVPLAWRLSKRPLLDSAEERHPFRAFDRHGGARLRRLDAALTTGREPRPADMAALIRRIGHDGRLRQVRDERWLTWRYANPLAAYRFVYCGDRELEGFIVLQKALSRHADRLRVTIMDCEAVNAEVMARLLRALPAVVDGQPLLAWRRALPREAARLLGTAGFVPQPLDGALARQRPCLLMKPLVPPDGAGWRPGGLDPADLESWDLRRLYGD
jgi:hypothetical protein